MKIKQKSTIGMFLETLSPSERLEMEQEYREFLLSELILARKENDQVAVGKLTQAIAKSTRLIESIHLPTD